MVTLRGRYDATPEDYPLNQAARWALARATSEPVRSVLENYIQDATEDIEKSSTEGFEIVFVLQHSLVMEKPSNGNGFRITRDSFTDKSVDNSSGIDNVIWEGEGKLFRNAPDYMRFAGSDVFCGLSTSVGNTPLFWGYFCGNNPENVQFLPHNGAF